MGCFHENSLIVALRFKIQDSIFKKKIMKAPFKQNITDFRKSKYVPRIALLKKLFENKLVLYSARLFHESSLIVACCTFGKLKI